MVVFICLLSIVYQSHLTIGGGLGSGYYVFNLQKININNEAGAADICFNCKTNWIKTRKMTNSTSKWHRPKRFKLINRIFQKELYSSFYKWGVYKIRLSILCVRKKPKKNISKKEKRKIWWSDTLTTRGVKSLDSNNDSYKFSLFQKELYMYSFPEFWEKKFFS